MYQYIKRDVAVQRDFELQKITPNCIILASKRLKTSYSEDAFGMSTYLIKHIVDIIVPYLVILMNRSRLHGIFPEILKRSVVIPIYKKGDKSLPANYRPITLVPIVSKIFEIIIVDQLNEFLNLNKIIHPCQYGFRPGYGTIDAIEKIVGEIIKNFEEKKITSVTLLDLSKAFDSVPHHLLVEKLKLYGIRGLSLNIIRTYLLNRRQAVMVNGRLSGYKTLNRGVPQGSIFGPILFVIFLNDLPKVMSVSPVLYADDTTLLMGNDNLDTLVASKNEELNTMIKWFYENDMTINIDKTESIYFSLKRDIIAKNKSNSIKYLGMYIDCSLNWKIHIQYLISKLSKSIYLIRKLRSSLSQKYICMAYHSLFHSQLNYGILFWGCSVESNLVFLWQKKAIRAILGLPFLNSCRGMFKKLKIMTVPCMFIYQCLIYINSHKDEFLTGAVVHSYSTRHNNNLITLKTRLTKTKMSYKSQGVKFYNLLPDSIKNTNTKKFKLMTKELLINCEGYNLKEIEKFICSVT